MNQFFGDKSLLKSMTAWGVFALALGQGLVQAGADAGFLSEAGVQMAGQVLTFIGTVLGGLGIRRAVGSSSS